MSCNLLTPHFTFMKCMWWNWRILRPALSSGKHLPPGVMLTLVGVWSLWKAGLLAVDSSSHEVPTCSRLGCWLISRVALGPSILFFIFFERWCLREEKNNLSDTRESASNQFERISWVLMDYRLAVHSVPLALLEYVTNCAFWHPGGVSISSLPRTHTLS